MLIQFIHPKDTNQTAVKKLSQQLQQFFNVTDYRINVGWIHSRTRSDQGFNIRSVKGSERYYLHTGKAQTTHQIGDLILFSYADSTRCEDRLDIVAQISVEELFDTKKSSLIISFLEFFYVIFAFAVKKELYTQQLENLCQLLLKQQYEDEVYQNVFGVRNLSQRLLLEHDALSNTYIHAYLLNAEEELPESVLIKLLKQKAKTPEDLDVLLTYADHKGFDQFSFAVKLVSGRALNVNDIGNIQLADQYSFLNAYIPKHPLWREMVLAHPDTLYSDDIAQKFIDELPEDKTQWLEALNQLPLNIRNSLANRLAEEHFAYVYQLISDEHRYIDHIMQCIEQQDSTHFAEYYHYAIAHHFHHVVCILKIFEYKLLQRPLPLYELNKIITTYSEALCTQHSQNNHLQKIQYTIFAKCGYKAEIEKEKQSSYQVKPTSYKANGLKPLSFCEGKIWFKKINHEYIEVNGEKKPIHQFNEEEIKDKERIVETSLARKVLCRRHDCNHCEKNSEHDLEEGIFYKVLREVQFDTTQLHGRFKENNQVLRTIAGLNRWNEILDRLSCQKCQSPFVVSEHHKNSMGKMAYSATYWHCSNSACHEYTHVVKLTHCLSCMGVIDSRESKIACNPYELLSYKKFYLCNNCASCCSTHGFKGTCPHCGLEDAYIHVSAKERTHAACRGCKKTVSIEKYAFENFVKRKQLPVKNEKIETESLLSEFKNGVRTLYVYDLYQALVHERVKYEKLKSYDVIVDVKILAKMAFMGLEHKNYQPFVKAYEIPDVQEDEFGNVDFETFEKLKAIADKALKRPYFHHLYKTIELPFTIALYHYSKSGLQLPAKKLSTFADKIEKARNGISFKIQQQTGVFASDTGEIKQYLKDKYQYDVLIQSKQDESLDHLLKKVQQDPVAHLYYQFDKLNRASSLVKAFANTTQDRVHPKYQILGTVTGRCTAKDPAILSFPKAFRSIFANQAGYTLYSFDYGQIELGVLAGLSGDQQLIQDYNQSDIYQELADEIEISRDQAKLFFLGLIYGIQDENLSKMMSMPSHQIAHVRQQIDQRYPAIDQLRQQCIEFGQQHGFINNMFGLHRASVKNRPNNAYLDQWENNWFFNFPIQSTAAGIFKSALVQIFQTDVKKKMQLVCPLYDEFLVQIPHADREYYIDLIHSCMSSALYNAFNILEPKVDLQMYSETSLDEYHSDAWLQWFDRFDVNSEQHMIEQDVELPF